MAIAISNELRHHVKHEVDHQSHLLPGQGPMSTFIHHNTLHGLQHLTFEEAMAEGERLLGGRGYLRNDEFRALYGSGRITDDDLRAAFEGRPTLNTGEVVAEIGDRGITAGDVYRAHLLYGVEPLDRAHLHFEIRERDATRRFRDDLPAPVRAAIKERAATDLRRSLDRVGRDWTLSDWIGYHTNLDLAGRVYSEVIRALAGDSSALGRATASALPPSSPSPSPSAERWLGEIEIPRDRWGDYIRCLDERLRDVPAAERERARDMWLHAESGWVKKLSQRHFGVRGSYGAIAAHFSAHLERYAVLSLWEACLASYVLEDPLSPTDPHHFQEQEADGQAEQMNEQFRHMERWGGPPIPLDAELHAAVQRLVETEVVRLRQRMEEPVEQPRAEGEEASALEGAHLCWFVLHDLGTNELNRRGLGALGALVSLRPDEGEHSALLARLHERDPRRKMREHVHAEVARELDELGRARSHADVLHDLTGDDISERVNAYMIRRCAAFLDEGQAAWRMPGRALGFYDAWRSLAASERIFDLEGLPGWRNALHHLPALAEDAVIEHLHALGVHHDHWGPYLGRLLGQLPGWGGMINWRARRPAYPRQQVQPIDLVQYLAVRLFYETLIVRDICRRRWQIDGGVEALQRHFQTHPSEFFVRRELFRGGLADSVAERARVLVEKRFDAADADDAWDTVADEIWACRESGLSDGESGPSIHRSAWRLFHLAQLLGLSGDDVRSLDAATRDRMIGALDSFPGSSHGPVWLDAYERHYRDQVLNALANNRAKGRWRTRPMRPKAQVMFCIDEREEAIHRHFEELDPGYETLGAAGFFGIAINYSALGTHETVPLCPPVIVPGHRVEEVPRPAAVKQAIKRLRRAKWDETLHNTYWEVKRNALSAYFLIDLIGFVQAVPLLGRILTPLGYAEMVERLRRRLIPPVSTMLTLSSDDEEIGTDAPAVKRGFSVEEQTDRIEAMLRNTGLTGGFARLVVICGHGSSSMNNPHESAHDCGACGGKHGGPNGRAFAGMANRPAVRAKLRERGIDIPGDTWFVGAQHNTCSELMTYFDTETIPPTHQEDWRRLVADLDEARARSAQERCRRFASAPKDASPRRSLRHIESRANNLSQVRPEWGHATNACAVVGRRSVTQGLFLDRRAFVISYDPSQDPSGMILERILLAVGPVGAGINLEYYFSTVDNQRWGSDTKVPHNVCGLIGVMEGAMSDLRTGLPKQMVEVHEAMRLQLIVEASNEVLGGIYGRQAAIRELLDNRWVHLIAMDPDSGEFSLFVPGKGFVRWDEPLAALPVVGSSFEWYRGQTDFLGPALIVEDGGDGRLAGEARAAGV